MSALVTVQALTRPAEVYRFPIEHGEPADNAEWQLVATVEPGDTQEFMAHSRKAIMVQTIPNIPE